MGEINNKNRKEESNRSASPSSYKIHNIAIHLSRFSGILILIYSAILYIIIPIISLQEKLTEPVGNYADIFLGLGICSGLMIFILLNKSHMNLFTSALSFAFWWFIIGNHVLDKSEEYINELPGYFYFIWIIWIVLAIIFLLSLIDFLIWIINLRYRELRRKSIRKTKEWFKKTRNLQKLAFLVILMIPAITTFAQPENPRILIEPKKYTIRYNWWVHRPNITEYDPQVLSELNKYSCNLDICGAWPHSMDLDEIEYLKDWEQICPNCTYRLVMTGENLSAIIENSKKVIERIVIFEKNGTLRNWRGLAYDIENPTFMTLNGFNSTEEAVEAWRQLFEWKHEVSINERNGKEIEMESIHSYEQMVDNFDRDYDLQKADGYVSLDPYGPPGEGWDIYAPMLYRCWYRKWMYPPYGSVEADPTRIEDHGEAEPFPTHYQFYRMVYQTESRLPVEKRGAYIGITNCSCYGRDLPQRPVLWYFDWENGTATGFGNLLRDILILKHFEVPEVTFFLLKTASDDGVYIMGGAFESYGIDFLEKVDKYINQNPPDQFYIKPDYSDMKGAEHVRRDWLMDVNGWSGFTENFLIIAASIIVSNRNLISRKKKNVKKV